MDDLQFRRCIYADPNSKDEETLAAIAIDPAKQKFVKELKNIDDKLSKAFNIPVPDDLYDNLILRQTLSNHQQKKRKTRVHLAMAASVTFAVGLSFTSFFNTYPTLGDYALAHTYHEAEYFSNDDEAKVTLASLNEKMSSFDGSFTDNLGELISADFCRFNGVKSLHLTYKGENTPVTVFIIPSDEDFTFSESFSDDKMKGKSLRFKDSNIIIVADKKESLDSWQKKIDAKVRWSI